MLLYCKVVHAVYLACTDSQGTSVLSAWWILIWRLSRGLLRENGGGESSLFLMDDKKQTNKKKKKKFLFMLIDFLLDISSWVVYTL